MQELAGGATLLDAIEHARANSLPPILDERARKDLSFLETLPRRHGGQIPLSQILKILGAEMEQHLGFFVGPDLVDGE